jgi:flagellar M-ring protein FliF
VLVIIVLIIFVIRPMLRKLINPEDTTEKYDEGLTSGVDLGDDGLDLMVSDFDESAVGFAPDGTLQLPDLHGNEDLLKAVRALVANEPELSAQVVKAWLTEDD